LRVRNPVKNWGLGGEHPVRFAGCICRASARVTPRLTDTPNRTNRLTVHGKFGSLRSRSRCASRVLSVSEDMGSPNVLRPRRSDTSVSFEMCVSAATLLENGTEESQKLVQKRGQSFIGLITHLVNALIRTTVRLGASWWRDAGSPKADSSKDQRDPHRSRDFDGEFDPGSGRTLAACLTHASRTGSIR
jgi:hypothetical protein